MVQGHETSTLHAFYRVYVLGLRTVLKVALLLSVRLAAANPVQPLYVGPADPNSIEVVHVVSMSHLDAGYKYPYVAQVASEWAMHWIPQSIALSQQLRRAGGEIQHKWTMNPWIASLFLNCSAFEWEGGDDGTSPSFRMRCPNATQVWQ